MAKADLVRETLELETHVLVPIDELVQLEADLWDARQQVAVLRSALEETRPRKRRPKSKPTSKSSIPGGENS